MNIIPTIQGSAEWLALRAQHFCASDAAAAMGLSKYKQRSELLREKATGYVPEVDAARQRLFDAGHASESAARPVVEARLGQDLYPCVGTLEVEGMPLLASLDGLTIDDAILWENKLHNESLTASVVFGELAPHYWAQLEHGLLVSGAEKAYFTTSDGTEVGTVGMWYESVPARRAQVIAAWKQFAIDLANYQPVEVLPAAVGKAPEALPALFIQVKGEVTDSNLAAFKDHALAVFGSINRVMKTDEDFANAAKAVTWCGEVESRLKAAKQHALSQTESIDKLFRTIDDISAEARKVRLELDGLVKTNKESRRLEILNEHAALFRAHIDGLNHRIGNSRRLLWAAPRMPTVTADFGGAMRGLKSFASMIDKCGSELARAKIEANEIADRIQACIAVLDEHAASHQGLFPDAATIVHKAPDDLLALVKTRIAEHERAEADRLERQRAKIAEEERVKAEAKVRAEAAAREKAERDEAQRQAQAAIVSMRATSEESAQVAVQQVMAQPVADQPLPDVVDHAAVVPIRPQGNPTMNLGKISAVLGFTVSAAFLAQIGCQPAKTERASVLYHDRDILAILEAMGAHLSAVYAREKAKFQPARTRTAA